MKYLGTGVFEKDYEVHAEDDNEARMAIIDLMDEEFPGCDIYLVKNIEELNT